MKKANSFSLQIHIELRFVVQYKEEINDHHFIMIPSLSFPPIKNTFLPLLHCF